MSKHHQCTSLSPQCPLTQTVYGYLPNIPANAIFSALFFLCTLIQLYFGIRARLRSFTIALVIGCFGEGLGYIGRIMMHSNPFGASFKIQICCLVLAPSFLAAGIYLSLKHLVLHLGADMSRIRPNWYPPIFIGCDVFSILLQAGGGGAAAAETQRLVLIGDKMIVAGISFQIATMTICGVLAVDYAVRVWMAARREGVDPLKGQSKLKKYIVSTSCAFTFIYVRCVYRVAEMEGGWGSPLMKKETEFMVLDGAMCCIAVILMTIFHPAIFFPQISKKYVIAQRAKVAEGDDELGLGLGLTPDHTTVVEKEPILESSGSMELAQGLVSESEEEVMGRKDGDGNALERVSR